MSNLKSCLRAVFACACTVALLTTANANEPTDMMEQELRSDAVHAWRYFERKSAALPGITAPNIWLEDEGEVGSYDIVTMWDVGSIILATVSARSLDIIDGETFDIRVRGILDFLKKAAYTTKSGAIPNFRSKTDTAKSVEAGYDATDTGRLFIALHVLDKATDGKYNISDLFSRWAIDSTIRNGTISDIKDGAIISAESNIYRYYVSRGYSLWSCKHENSYSGALPGTSDAATSAFLDELGRIGPIATEPSAAEVVELGASPFSTAILGVLGKRQQTRFDETGKLTSVSETPIDRAPWFTYQGLDLTQDGEAAWTVYPYHTEKRWAKPSFASENRIVNSKAAFLWLAVEPSEYTKKVWKYVREKARSNKYGFHPGVYEATEKPVTNIDLNTNAAILEAAAYILKGRTPLSDQKVGL
ncbi:MAG: DUF3131 domain-containing protein [Hyphomicrobiaceae bacterium]|nr:DUF3131 domain-containing protein [Hyphomicrobiaceae bacterium]